MLGHNIRCLVPGCHSDLLREREFNLRNKICEFHQRAKVLVVDGAEHRFCQQCTRLHPIDAFDGNKRGCRSRLERHNKRCAPTGTTLAVGRRPHTAPTLCPPRSPPPPPRPSLPLPRLATTPGRRRLANIITKGLDKPEDEAVDTSKPEVRC